MDHGAIGAALAGGGGPAALIFAEDEAALPETVAHHLRLGFARVLVFAPEGAALPDLPEGGTHVPWHLARTSVAQAVTAAIRAAPGRWLYWGYNGEYLFYPHSDTRTVAGLIEFHASERRSAVFATLVDLYSPEGAGAPALAPGAEAWFDRTGYFSEGESPGEIRVFGGLRRRFSEHVPEARQRIDRIALFRAERGLELGEDLRFNRPGYNTDACPWHRNVTACVASIRAAKALVTNPASREAATRFRWAGSERFDWTPAQLMEAGLMEPGQWF